MDEKISTIVQYIGKLPYAKVHPNETYAQLSLLGINDVKHPKDLYKYDPALLSKYAKTFIEKERIKLAGIAFGTGLPGGAVSITGGVILDIEEYVRRIFILAQRVGHTFGIIPIPFVKFIPDNIEDYFDSVHEEILKAVLLGFGTAGISMGIAQFSKLLAEKEAKEIIHRKISEKAITELSKYVAKVIGKEVTKKSISRTTGRIIPIVGGAINATFAYYALRKIGNNLVKNMMKEHIEVKPNVIYLLGGRTLTGRSDYLHLAVDDSPGCSSSNIYRGNGASFWRQRPRIQWTCARTAAEAVAEKFLVQGSEYEGQIIPQH